MAGGYPQPPSRRPMVLAGVAIAIAVAGAIAWGQLTEGSRWATKGPLSSSHALFGEACSNCHQAGERRVTDVMCSNCHERFGDEIGTFTFAAHYVYRSDDFRRVVPSAEERPCFACHLEHEGREARITRVPDARCQPCHFASFERDHPQFDFAAAGEPDSAALRFAHVHHTREVMKRLRLEDLERACLACHEPDADGRGFGPIDFDRHCDACHLTATTATPGLPVLGVDGNEVGVETVEQIISRGAAGSRWAWFADPTEFRRRGALVVKGPLHHRDPWVLENLRRLRHRLYPDAGLADLLRASPDAPPGEIRSLYDEAVATLEEQVLGLRGRPEPEIQAELKRIEAILGELRRRIAEPFAPLDESEFVLALQRRDEGVGEAEAAAIEALVADLTEPCRGCHELRAATIARVDRDQSELHRAEFDHRAHIVHARCLDCHAAIPVAEHLAGSEKLDEAVDGAAIHNLPRIETCRRCHTARLASDRCVTCHWFHPDKSRRSELLLYRQEMAP